MLYTFDLLPDCRLSRINRCSDTIAAIVIRFRVHISSDTNNSILVHNGVREYFFFRFKDFLNISSQYVYIVYIRLLRRLPCLVCRLACVCYCFFFVAIVHCTVFLSCLLLKNKRKKKNIQSSYTRYLYYAHCYSIPTARKTHCGKCFHLLLLHLLSIRFRFRSLAVSRRSSRFAPVN